MNPPPSSGAPGVLAHRRGAGSPAAWRRHAELYGRLREQWRAATPKAGDVQAMLDACFECVAADAALGDEDALTLSLAELAAVGGAAMLRMAFAGDAIAIRWPGGQERLLGEGPARLTPPWWLAAFCSATLVRDRAALQVLAAPEHLQRMLDATDPGGPEPGAQAWWPPLCRALAGALRGDADAPAQAGQARAALDAEAANDSARLLKRPLPDLIERVATLQFADWPAQVGAAVEAFDRFYAEPDTAGLSGGFLPLAIAALCAMADEHGAPAPAASPYLPPRLIGGRFVPPRFEVWRDLGQHRARSAAEIRWWLDLQGLPREGRSHRLEGVGDTLVARHECLGAAGAPPVRAGFVVDADAPPLLDAEQLLQVSDLHARQATLNEQGGAPVGPQAQPHLEDSLEALDQALALLQQQGRDPARIERLLARRAAYATLLDECRAARQEAAARAGSLAWIEVIRLQLEPLLRALAAPGGRELLPSLRPRDEDYERVFATPGIAEAARRAYAPMWSGGLSFMPPRPDQQVLQVHIAPAGMLATDNELSRRFPGGYRSIAQQLNPHRVWACWRYTQPGESVGLAFDGLAWCDDHWAWFPKPYRLGLGAEARS